MQSSETPLPRVIYTSFFRRPNPPFSLSVNRELSAELVQELGMAEERIRTLRIRITPQVGNSFGQDTAFLGGYYDWRRHQINLLPLVIWVSHYNVLSGLRVITYGSANLKTIDLRDNDLEIKDSFIDKIDEKGLEKALTDNSWTNYSQEQAAQIINLAQRPETLSEADAILGESVNRTLRNWFAHELRHSKDKHLKLLNLLNEFAYGHIPSTLARWLYAIDPEEIRARRFAEKTVNNPQYDGLITTGQEWEYSESIPSP